MPHLCNQLKNSTMTHNGIFSALGRLASMAIAMTFIGGTATAQNISVSSAQNQSTATFLGNNLIGNGVYIWNVKFNNATGNIGSPQLGTFNSNGYQSLMMDEGVIMTTGNISVASGPNSSGSSSASASGSWTDNTLGNFTGYSVTSCATIDFDFVSISPFITVNYSFGSEEYPEYVCSSFNDVFGFLITGPHLKANGTWQYETWNAACIPYTTNAAHPNGIAVAINTVNNGHNNTPSDTNGVAGCTSRFHEFYVSNASGSNGVEYDGFTRKLSANATLQPCTQYHMHISVCNVGDNSYDSGVFIEKESFNSPAADVNLSHRESTPIQRSQTETHSLSLAGSSYTHGYVQATFGGTAEAGVDYVCRTDSGIVINNDNRNFHIDTGNRYISITPTATANLTNPKTLNIYLRTSLCDAYPELYTYDTIRYTIVEDNIVRLRDTVIHAIDTCRSVGVEVAVGSPIRFHWDPEDDIDFPNQQYSSALITESRNYRVSAEDAEGHTDTAEVQVIVTPHAEDGIAELSHDEFSVRPNPTNGMATVYLKEPLENAGEMLLIDISGKTMERVELPSGTIDLTLDLTAYPKGTYLLKLLTPDKVGINKLIKE